MKVFWKKCGISVTAAAYVASSFFVTILPVTPRLRRILRIRNTSSFAKLALSIFGVRISVNRRHALHRELSGCLIVANHLSYVDVLVLSSLMPSVFITSEELRNTPLLGMLAHFGGSLFVERRKPVRLRQEIREIAAILARGFPVVLFPEGTTSNGDCVRPFKNSLFDAAVTANAPVVPLCLRYTEVNGNPVSSKNRDAIYYYGGITFFTHFPRLLSIDSVVVDVTPLDRMNPDTHGSRKELAAKAHKAITAAYAPGPPGRQLNPL